MAKVLKPSAAHRGVAQDLKEFAGCMEILISTQKSGLRFFYSLQNGLLPSQSRFCAEKWDKYIVKAPPNPKKHTISSKFLTLLPTPIHCTATVTNVLVADAYAHSFLPRTPNCETDSRRHECLGAG